MPFILERVNPFDRDVLYSDLKDYPDLIFRLKKLMADEVERNTWTIDRASNAFLILLPDIIRTDRSDNEYLFCVNKWVFKLINTLGSTD
ncbi:MAG: hypothetical protein MI864_23810 [Pseudomonadales bacterium]|nr:hypothetical protein [Pseudomonadales bacterium]